MRYSNMNRGYYQESGKIINSKPVPMVQDKFIKDERGEMVPDMEFIRDQAKKLNAKIVRTNGGAVLYFNDNYVLIGADQGERLNTPEDAKKDRTKFSLQLGGQVLSEDEAYDKVKRNYPDLSDEQILEIIDILKKETDDKMASEYMGEYYIDPNDQTIPQLLMQNDSLNREDMQQGGRMMNREEETEDQDGGMALGQIRAMQERLARLQQMIRPNSDLEPWVASKITLADDYLNSVNDYMTYNPEQTGEEDYEEYDENMMNPQVSQEAMMMMQQDVPMEMMRYGGMTRYAEGGGIPPRYKNMGFTKVGAKRQSTRPGKKWMVLAKKGDDYKVVHGGYKGMKDFTQHGSEKRRDNFWNRMGGKDSSKAKDPFSPLYWHKRFGTWKEGGKLYNINSLSNVDNIGYIDDMRKGGMFNLAKARVLYRKGIHNFDQRNPYEHGGYMNDNLSFIEKNRMMRMNRKP